MSRQSMALGVWPRVLLTVCLSLVLAWPSAAAVPSHPGRAGPVSEYAVDHVVFGTTQLDLLTTGAWASYVHDDRDSFMLLSGNNTGDINCSTLNSRAATVKSHYPNAPIYAATSGIENIENGAPCLDETLFSGLMMVYEPNQDNAPEFSWDQETTEQTFADAADAMRIDGLEAWSKPSGRAAAGRDHFGDWDYGVLGNIMDGQNIQTQGSCRDRDGNGDYTDGPDDFADAVQSIQAMYARAGTTSELFLQVTTSSEARNPNAVPPEKAMQCAEVAWSLPEVDRVTLWTAIGDQESRDRAATFYQMREDLIEDGEQRWSDAPYPRSTSITGVTFDWETHRRDAPGSDNWATTWGADGHLYTVWGDGGGFGGTNSDGRSGIGVARVEGPSTGYTGFNVFGGKDPEGNDLFGGYSDPTDYYRGTFGGRTRAHGKSYSILSVDGVLYMWVSPRSNIAGYIETRLARSTDDGASWDLEDWSIPGDGGPDPNVVQPAALQVGQNYAGVPGHAAGYVYLYFIGLKDSSALAVQRPGEIYLARAPANHADIRDPAAYEWYSSTSSSPSWSSTPSDRQPVFEDSGNGVGWTTSVHYNSGLGRYILMTEHDRTFEGNLGMFESTRPWGPWRTVAYQDRWRGRPSDKAGSRAFYWNIPTKWISSDGKSFTLVFTGVSTNDGVDDSWNTVTGSFRTSRGRTRDRR